MTRNSTQLSRTIDVGAYVESRVGEPYTQRGDCVPLVRSVQRDLFGIELSDPFNLMLERHFWREIKGAKHGTMVLMTRPHHDHVGVCLEVGGRFGILHSDEPHGVVFDTLLEVKKIRRFEVRFFERCTETSQPECAASAETTAREVASR